MELISNLKKIQKQFGNKSNNLIRLFCHNLPVKNGLVLSTKDINRIEKNEKEIFNEIDIKLSQLKGNSFAVRSSTTLEDGKTLSWAGQFDTFLNIERKKIFSTILEIIRIEKEKKYDNNYSFKGDNYLGLLIQEMVDPQYSGVTFTTNPVTFKKEVVIEYINGLSNKLLKGGCSPKRIIYSRYDSSLEKELNKEFNSLNVLQIFELIEISIKLEDFFKAHINIEWAIEKNTGILFINQVRPISFRKPKIDNEQYFKLENLLNIGIPISTGTVCGSVLIINEFSALELKKIKKHTIIVTRRLTPQIILFYKKLSEKKGGIIAEEGGMLSHAAIIARELQIPAIVGVKGATKNFNNNKKLCMDGNKGQIFISKEG